MSHSVSDQLKDQKSGSVPEKTFGFTVSASPLNPVKLELGVILIVGFFLFFIITNTIESQLVQLGVLATFGTVAMLWLVFRVRALIANLDDEQKISQ